MNHDLLYKLNQEECAFDTEDASIEDIITITKAAFPDDTGYLRIEQGELLQYIVYWPKSDDFDRRLWICRNSTKLPSYRYQDFLKS